MVDYDVITTAAAPTATVRHGKWTPLILFLFLFSVIETLIGLAYLQEGFWLLKESYLQIGDRSPGSAWDVVEMNLRNEEMREPGE